MEIAARIVSRILTTWTVFCVLSVVGNATAPSEFEQVVRPYLEQHCTRCHGAEKQKGKLALHNVADDFSAEASVKKWTSVLDQLSFDEMPPPEEKKRPNSSATSKVVEWINLRLEESGKAEAYKAKLLAPEYGNWVDHEKLFSGEIDTPPFSPSRLWRISPEIFALKGFGNAKSPYTYVTSERGIRDYAAMSVADQSTVQMMTIAANAYIANWERRGEFKEFADDKPTPREEAIRAMVTREFGKVIGRNPDKGEQEKYMAFLKQSISVGGNLDGLKTMIKAMFLSPESIFRMEFGLGEVDEHGRRHLAPEELAYAIAYALTDKGPHHNRFIKEALQKEKLKTKEDIAGLVRQMLDEQLLTGHWDRKDLPRVMRFFDEFFGFHRAGTVFKDNDRRRKEKIPQWNTGMLIHDARMLIEHVLREDKDVIAELLTTNEYFVAHPGDNDYAKEHYEARIAEVMDPGYIDAQVEKRRKQIERDFNFKDMPEKAARALEAARKEAEKIVTIYQVALDKGMYRHPGYPFSKKSRGIGDLIYIEPYNLPSNNRIAEQKWDWPLEQPLEMPKEQRAGILTHPAWLAAYSLNEDNDPIHRGIWVFERLLAGVLWDVPPDVDAAVPTDPHLTLRERMEPLRNERCWKCHRKMNPLGEPFEIFDDWGRYREKHYFDENGAIFTRRDGDFDRKLKEGKLTTRKVDASGEIAFSGDPKVDGKVKDAVEMMHRIGHSERARQSFIRHLFRYMMGRNEMLSDSRTLIEAEKAYLDNGGSFKALIVSLLSSDSFLYRK